MNSVSAKAPGKIMLLGEHAVVYGHPCLVSAIKACQTVSLKKLSEPLIDISSVNLDFNLRLPLSELSTVVPNQARFVVASVNGFYRRKQISHGLRVNVVSGFDNSLGLGSSSAVTVAVVSALFKLFSLLSTPEEIFDLSYDIVLSVQGVASGFDVAAAVYGGVVYYAKGKPVVNLPKRRLPLIVAYSGFKADTVTLINMVSENYRKNPEKIGTILSSIGAIADEGMSAYRKSDWEKLGRLFTQNHELLVKLGVSSPVLNTLMTAALDAGAFGAKLSGAGGGDCLVALYREGQKGKLVDVLTRSGGRILDVL